jgi:hypothetical protein
MAMGIFEQLAWLTKRVNRLCCAILGIKIGGLTSTNINITPLEETPGYTITEGGIYQFYGGTGTGIDLTFTFPTSAGQIMHIINTSADSPLTLAGDRPHDNISGGPLITIGPYEYYQLISMEDINVPGTFIWIAFKIYPYS